MIGNYRAIAIVHAWQRFAAKHEFIGIDIFEDLSLVFNSTDKFYSPDQISFKNINDRHPKLAVIDDDIRFELPFRPWLISSSG